MARRTKRDENLSGLGARRRNALENSNGAYAAKQAEIVQSAAQLFAERGYDGTNLNDIAVAANMDRASLYYYFESKAALLEAAMTTAGTQIVEEVEVIMATEADAMTKMRRIVRILLTAIHDEYPFSVLYFQEDVRHSPLQADLLSSLRDDEARILGCITKLAEDGRREGTLRDDVPTDLIMRIVNGTVAWTYRWFRPGCGFAVEDVITAIDAILYSGLMPRDTSQQT